MTTLRFHPDGGILATAQKNGVIKLWDISTQQEFSKLQDPSRGEVYGVSSISFSENGYYLAACGEEDNQVRVWDIRKDTVVKKIQLPEESYVSKVHFDKSGSYLSLSGHGIYVYNVKSEQIHDQSKFDNHKNICTAVLFEESSDKYFVSASMDGDVMLHSLY